MNKRIAGICLVLATAISGAFAQGTKSLKINEVLVTNENNFQDDYGQQSAWIEIFNTSFSNVDIRSCFLTNDRSNPTMYPIPKGDVLTKIPPRQHLLFWADGMPNRGTFHLNFTLDPNKENWIYLFEANGKTPIDSVLVPANLPADCSWARKMDGVEEPDGNSWEIKGLSPDSYVTPSTNNVTLDSNEKIAMFRDNDSFGIGMSILAMGVVFAGLILLYLCFRFIGKLSIRLAKRNAMKAHGITDKEEAKRRSIGDERGEVFAAIAMALYEYQELHDIENTILTIHKVQRNYSPWSSKIHMLRKNP